MEPLHTEQFRLAMDYGQFLLRGNARFDVDEMALLERAQRELPSANVGTDGLIVVLSPHQNNFDMVIDVQRWERRPRGDRDDWQQVSEDHLTIDEDGTLTLESPTTEPLTYDLDPGDYIAEVSGKDFVAQGWPGSTTPGDSWRIRLWPDTGENLQPPKLWPGPEGQPPKPTPLRSLGTRASSSRTSRTSSLPNRSWTCRSSLPCRCKTPPRKRSTGTQARSMSTQPTRSWPRK